jgi:hypothetical protein
MGEPRFELNRQSLQTELGTQWVNQYVSAIGAYFYVCIYKSLKVM